MEVFNQAYDELTGEISFKVSSSSNYASVGKGFKQIQELALQKVKIVDQLNNPFRHVFKGLCLERLLGVILIQKHWISSI